MLMMCIRGKQRPRWHTGLVSGMLYEVSVAKPCCVVAAHAEGSVFRRPVRMRCNRCGSEMRSVIYVPWDLRRFVPWASPKVELAEVQRLYRPGRIKEKA